jgi:phage terminase large subunit
MSSSQSSIPTTPTINADVPRKLAPLLQPYRYKGAYGGRGGAKSHFFAEQIILRCYLEPLRVVCIREVQKTIRDSVRQLLCDKIEKFGLGAFYDVRDTEIRGANGALIIFRGMQHYNAESIKSLEGYDIAWIEEAQTLSQVSFDLLRPTIRKEGSEIWASWNPRHRTDPIDIFFRKNPPSNAVSVMVNWRDNPWFPDVLYKEMLEDKARDPDAAEHIWEGAYGVQAGAILGRWVSQAEKENRVHMDVEYDQSGPGVEISSDIGFRDTSSWWFWQRRIGGFAVLREIRDSGLEAAD